MSAQRSPPAPAALAAGATLSIRRLSWAETPKAETATARAATARRLIRVVPTEGLRGPRVGGRVYKITLRMSKRPLFAGLVLAVLVCALVAGASRLGLLESAELEAYDLLVRRRPPPPPLPSVAVVDFDDETFARLGVFPAPRTVLAEVLQRIAAGGPELIGLDVLLSEKRPAEAEGERRLAAALAEAGNVILADNFGGNQLASSEPLPEFREHAFDVGFVNLLLDADGFVRRMYLAVRTAEYQGVSFAVALVTNYVRKPLETGRQGGFRIGSTEIPLDGSGLP